VPPYASCTISPAARGDAAGAGRPHHVGDAPQSCRGRRDARKKAAATVEISAPIGDDLFGLRDRALLLMGFIGATRRSELAAIKVANLEPAKRGMTLRLAISKGDREGKGVTVALPCGKTRPCPVRTLQRWPDAAGW
jgi:hypothetical protein